MPRRFRSSTAISESIPKSMSRLRLLGRWLEPIRSTWATFSSTKSTKLARRSSAGESSTFRAASSESPAEGFSLPVFARSSFENSVDGRGTPLGIISADCSLIGARAMITCWPNTSATDPFCGNTSTSSNPLRFKTSAHFAADRMGLSLRQPSSNFCQPSIRPVVMSYQASSRVTSDKTSSPPEVSNCRT